MTIALSHKSALIILLRNRQLASERRLCFPPEIRATPDDIEQLRRDLDLGKSPLDALITERKQRFCLPPETRIHYAKNARDIPSFIRLEDAYVSSPELLFVQFAANMTLIETILLGYYLCGDYRPASERKKTGNLALTSADKLREYIENLPQTKGKRRAAQAIRYVIDNSNSPQESRMTIILILPPRLGGYNLLMPKLNQAIPGTNKIGDVCWLDHGLILEYDSTLHHQQEDQQLKDAVRRVKIELEDYRVISVVPDQVQSLEYLEELATLTRRALHQQKRPEAADFRLRQAALHKELFGRYDLPF